MNTPNRRGATFDCLSLLALAAPLLAVVLQRAIANPLQGSQNRSAAANGRRSSPLARSGSGTIHTREKKDGPRPAPSQSGGAPGPEIRRVVQPGSLLQTAMLVKVLGVDELRLQTAQVRGRLEPLTERTARRAD